jgi:fatty-acyl-CoA synthase
VDKPQHYRSVRLTESYWPADKSRALLESTLGDSLRAAAAENPHRCALVEGVADAARRRRWTYRELDTLALAEGLRSRLPALREIIRLSSFDGFVGAVPALQKFPRISPSDRCIIMFTSGTTGAQKGVEFHHRGIVNVTNFTQERGGLALGGVFVNPMPMFHIGALGHAGVGAVMRRATHVLASEWNRELFMDLVQSEKGTYSLLVPTMIEAILGCESRGGYDLSSLTNIVSGAAIVEASLIERSHAELGSSVCNIYGQTEMQGVVSAVHCDDSPQDQSQTIGQPMPQVEVKIADPQSGRILPLDTQGEICVRGYQTMIGYFNMPEATARTLEADGWLHSGDLGMMDARGFLKITGRIKDLIKRGGEAIYPREIENLLLEHPKVAHAAVVGIPDAYWGEQVAAVIIPKSHQDTPLPAQLHEFCREHLAAYKTPRFWCFTDLLPATETGKLQKFKLVESIVSGVLKCETV